MQCEGHLEDGPDYGDEVRKQEEDVWQHIMPAVRLLIGTCTQEPNTFRAWTLRMVDGNDGEFPLRRQYVIPRQSYQPTTGLLLIKCVSGLKPSQRIAHRRGLSPPFQAEAPSLHLTSGPRSADLMNMNQKFLVATSAGNECASC